jgi:hypothetical protein
MDLWQHHTQDYGDVMDRASSARRDSSPRIISPSQQRIPRPLPRAVALEMPVLNQHPEMLLQHVAADAGQPDHVARRGAAMLAGVNNKSHSCQVGPVWRIVPAFGGAQCGRQPN